jgi:uncharacterized protein (DUF433 family)/DNA-binding transcriptional MerR regulator
MPETLLGVGLYSLSEAARLLHINAKTLRRWAEGYPFIIGGEAHASAPILRRDLSEVDGEPVLTFHDLLELYMVKLFRDAGVSLQTIRAASEKAAAMYHTDHPFAIKQFETDGRAIFATLQDHGVEGVPRPTLLQDLNLSQMVMDSIARPFFKKIEYQDFEPLRYWPNGRDRHIVLDPKRSFGKPIDARSGVSTAVLYAMARSGETVRSIADWYDVDVEAVEEAVAFEYSLKAA